MQLPFPTFNLFFHLRSLFCHPTGLLLLLLGSVWLPAQAHISGTTVEGSLYVEDEGTNRAQKFVLSVSAPTCPIYVNATGSNDGTSWPNAYTSLQTALAATNIGTCKEVWVASGLYKPTTVTTDRTTSFTLGNNVKVYGGFAGVISETAVTNRVLTNPSSTTLSGDINSNNTPTGNSFHVLSLNNVTDVVLDGLVVTGGNADGSGTDASGGGLYSFASSYSVVNTLFRSNIANSSGGGVWNTGGVSTLTSCSVVSNSAASGGGLYSTGAHVSTISGSLFDSNTASSTDNLGGGAIVSLGSNSTVVSSTVTNNSSGLDGGGLLYDNNTVLTNCFIARNRAQRSGGGVTCTNTSSTSMTSCSLVENRCSTFGGGLYNYQSSPVLSNCVFERNTANVGGGVQNFGSSPTLTNCIFQSNTANGSGGGLASLNTGLISQPILSDCQLINNTAGIFGGGVFSDAASHTLTHCMLQDNSAPFNGGGMANINGGQSRLSNCTIEGNRVTNTANGYGGGIFNKGGHLTTLSQTLIRNNTAPQSGGGLLNNGGSSTLTSCTVVGNSTGNGAGGIFNENGHIATLINSFVLSNTATSEGGGLYNVGTVFLAVNLTVENNYANDQGGGMHSYNSSLTLCNTSFRGNTANARAALSQDGGGTIWLFNTVVFGNGTATKAVGVVGGSTIQATYSLFETGTTGGNITTEQTNILTGTSPYANPTGTQLAANSEARDAGLNSAPGLAGITGTPAATDLAGNLRTVNCAVDMGAYEEQTNTANAPVVIVAPATGSAVCAGNVVSTSVAVRGSGQTFLWYRNGVALNDQTTPTLSLSNVQFANAGSYSVAITCIGSIPASTTSGPFNLSINGADIIQQPVAGSAVCVGATVTAFVSATDSQTPSLTYVWYKTGATGGPTLVSGQVSATLTLGNTQTADAGSYSAVITGSCGSVTSTAFSLTVDNAPAATLSNTSGGGGLTCAKLSLTLTAGPVGNGFNYGFSGPNGVVAGSASDPSRSISRAGTYTMLVTNTVTSCTATAMKTVNFAITGVPEVSLSASTTVLSCSTPSIQLVATPGATTFVFSGPGINQVGPTNTITASQSGLYSVTVLSGPEGACVATAQRSLTSGAGVPPSALLLGSGNLSCTTPTLTLTATGGASYVFSGPGLVSQFGGTEGILVGSYILNRRTIPTLGTAVVNKPGQYTVLVTDERGCTGTATINVTGQECR